MDVKYDFGAIGDQRIVYVRSVEVADLPKEVQDQVGDTKTLYAVHDENGQQLALVADRNMAFVLARQNDLSPVTVH
ncbi:DUF1150 domain-containing protein [Lutimaribacter sp. EGI FJ00015]|uniref:DUF1150 domain-containing protein n=1 Tax=Lutimaribacter degradans TaxID=2945989 RepID=A0ACC5ZYB6_9RHOB|nr:DUF1150 family protein [Lutimaribacter sp. EGI FJ00013]MCM2563297.1 DUF1150 domain-containing protein [Lutimaribacter sp. EGI FJ00013]MCO0614380.1 DUF1150 domain-containing protein [Lutimaribacter sp. EGI FJ00015]MCO0636019.1 DUF1150 domain-containing protein [Lutimaribacter sp. EGI FJ00014]